jgi:hypothetical protein
MADPYRNEEGLRDFLFTTWAGYVPGGEVVEEVQQPDGSLVGTTIDGSWKMVDTYHVNPRKTLFNGREVIFKDNEPVWAANYHTVIAGEENSPSVLGFFYGVVAANPNPEFPVTAINGVHDERFSFRTESLLTGKLAVAHFVLKERIHDKSYHDASVYRSHVAGGWIS